MLTVEQVYRGDNLRIVHESRRDVARAALRFMRSIEEGTAVAPVPRESGERRESFDAERR